MATELTADMDEFMAIPLTADLTELDVDEGGGGATVEQIIAAFKADSQLGLAGMVANVAAAANDALAAKNLLEADQILVVTGGYYNLETRLRGTTTKLIPDKAARTPTLARLANPLTEELAGYTELDD